jgi:amidase
MQRISRQWVTSVFRPDAVPVATVAPGETVIFETQDAQAGEVRSYADALSVSVPLERANPATGPVAVSDALPGDTLAVHIVAIRLGDRGLSRIKATRGVIVDQLSPPAARLMRVEDDMVHFDDRIRFPVRPMVGTIGTAPAEGTVYSFHPGPHGGNLDINEVTVGATIYLPVAVPGALLALGDVHAIMGDGEVTGAGVDISAEVTVRPTLQQGLAWPRPVIESPTAWSTCASAPTLVEAIRLATEDMTNLLACRLQISREEAFILIGSAGDARIGQACQGPLDATAYIRISKAILASAF